ncbi:hypothetical protein [Sporosarcina luteola]|uniref:hypothetical protein n=1 Tax=Sporosarcina luteola TaxID=582850 RepID=UPI00203C951F|nr:hypothetical protein [Sporosarcina luteola]MCM3711500.1 hypothetical protein [Sporosarcina luteola]
MTNEKKGRFVILILIILTMAFAIKSIMQHPRLSDVPDLKFTTEWQPATYQIYEKGTGIRVERFNRWGLFRTAMNCEDIALEYVENGAGDWLVLKGCGPKKIDKEIDYLK